MNTFLCWYLRRVTFTILHLIHCIHPHSDIYVFKTLLSTSPFAIGSVYKYIDFSESFTVNWVKHLRLKWCHHPAFVWNGNTLVWNGKNGTHHWSGVGRTDIMSRGDIPTYLKFIFMSPNWWHHFLQAVCLHDNDLRSFLW